MTDILLSITGGLALFLYAVSKLSESVRAMVGERSEKWLLRFTGNIFSCLLTGMLVTFLLDSSSAVIIITIVMVNAGILKLRQSMGIVLGANIGTTLSSQIIAMDVGKYSPAFLAAGMLLLFFSKTDYVSNAGKVVLYFGILFFGLYTMERAVEPLRSNDSFAHLLQSMDNPTSGTLAGAVVTLIIQSSSATVGMAIVLVKKGLLSLSGGIAVMMGAELGTVSDTLLATIKGTRQAVKTGIFHFIFNLTSILLGLALFVPFTNLVHLISIDASPERNLANAHVMFNVLGVVLFVFLVPYFERLLNFILPDKQALESAGNSQHQ